MTPRRVLICANFDRKKGMRNWFSTEHALLNGFVRAGHLALPFSDRDAARELSFWRSSRSGAAAMNAALLDAARHFRPHLILFGHADLIRAETFDALRRAAPGARLAQFNVDSVERAETMARFSARAAHLDFSAITTAAPEALAALSPREGAVGFMPNPLDPAFATASSHALGREALSADVVFLGNGDEGRDAQAAALRDALADELRLDLGGGVLGTARVTEGGALMTRLGAAAQGPVFPLNADRPVPHLYASNRLALLLTQGVLAHAPASARQGDLYGEGVVAYEDADALAENITRFARDDSERRRVAELGWRAARDRTDCALVADYLLRSALGENIDNRYAWPVARY